MSHQAPPRSHQDKGFTLVELMIATVVFSIILLMTLGGFLQIGRTFYKGITISRTETTIRNIADDLSGDIRASTVAADTGTQTLPGINPVSYFCIGQHVYYFRSGVIFDNDPLSNNKPVSSYGLKRADITGVCNSTNTNLRNTIAASTGSELLGEKMRVSKLAVSCSNIAINRLCDMSIHIAYGDNDLLDSQKVKSTNPDATPGQLSAGDDATCKGATAGTQFCATADINTSILRGGDS